jgi:RHS repeat-associated protein
LWRRQHGDAAGGVAGFYQKTELQRGESGSPILQQDVEYILRLTDDGETAVPAIVTVSGQTTTYSYTWFGTTAGIESVTVSLPSVSSGENGPGGNDVLTTYFDTFQRPIWHKDGDGFLHYTAYDMGTGAVTKTIDDVSTAQTGDFAALPAGWTTPSGGGLHLKTLIEVDGLGRSTKITAPAGNVTYAVYKDTVQEVRIYAGWDTTLNKPTGPTQLLREDRARGYFEVLTMSATPDLLSGEPTGGEAISNVETVSRAHTNNAWQVTHVDEYFLLAGLTYTMAIAFGTENTNFYRTRYNYDDRGRRNKLTTPTGTIYKTEFDALGRVVAEKVGTTDLNLVQTAGYVYDNGLVGDGNLTQMTLYPEGAPGSAATNRVSEFYFDWRNRLVAVKAGVEATESTSLNRPIYYFELNNLGQVTASEQYDGDGVTVSDSDNDGVPDKPSVTLRRARSETRFDDQGRLYQTKTFSVDQGNGSLSTGALTTNIWYGRRGQVLKMSAPGGLVSKAEYDGAGRIVKSYLSDGGGDTAWSHADDVVGDKVLEQVETTYDANSNPIFVTIRERFHDETATGALGNPTTAPKARVSYSASYYDLADRLTATVNVGTNAGTTYTRPGSVPLRSDTTLVVSYGYNNAGWVSTVTDPRGIEDRIFYDNLGRTTKTIEAYADGTPDGGSDRTTEYTFNGNSQVRTVKAWLTGTAYETTEFVYGVSTPSSGVNSNDLLGEMRYPDKSTGDPSATEKEIYTYNALGQRKSAQDRNANIHAYSFDVVGRLTSDAVTQLGTGVDGAVRRLEIAYDTAGRAFLFTSYDAASAGSIVNQVQRDFNGLGQLTAEHQSHAGAVIVGTTPKVQYGYSEMTGGANHSRLISMTYPNARQINYNYTAAIDAAISRLTSMSDTTGTLESLDYLGLDTVVRRAHSQPGVDLTYIKQGVESNGDAGDQYTGLDRFGRVVDQRWIKTSDGSHTDRFKYGYDRNGNRLYRQNVVNAAFSELYHADGAGAGYDSLGQLLEFQRGTLSDTNADNVPDTVVTSSRSQAWTLDAQGNWSSLNTDGTTVSRTHNKQNQVTAVGGTSLTFDANGNLKQDQTGKQFLFDAWNRLVQVKDSGGATLASHNFDALGRRIVETVSGTTKDLYYSAAWQVLEERQGSATKTQYVWSPVYVDALVLRDRDADGSSGNGLEERVYVQQDANFNVTGLIKLVDTSWTVVERYVYDAYGQPTFLDASWTTLSGSAYAFNILHQGGRYETVTGLYHFRNRELHPTLGRWLQSDPLGFGAGDTNLYRYVGNHPTIARDPSGLSEPPSRLWMVTNQNRPIPIEVFLPPNGQPLFRPRPRPRPPEPSPQNPEANSLLGPRPPRPTRPMDIDSLMLTESAQAQGQEAIQSMQFGFALLSLLPGPQGQFAGIVGAGLSVCTGNREGAALAALPFLRVPRYIPGYGWTDPAYWRLVTRLRAGESLQVPTLRIAAQLRRDAFPELVRSRYRGLLRDAPDFRGTYDWHDPRVMIHPGPHQTPHIQIWLSDGPCCGLRYSQDETEGFPALAA